MEFGDKMKKILAISLLLAILLCGCAETAPSEREIFAMDTLMTLRIWGDDSLAADAVAEINRLDSLFSVTDENSEIFALNRDGSATVSEETSLLIDYAAAISRRTDGAFDPTVYPLVELWGFTRETQNVPTQSEINAALSLIDAERMSIDGDKVFLIQGAKIDLGGIAKGYTAQTVIDFLKNNGVESAFLSLGGNVQTLGSKPDGSAWMIGIADPDDPSHAIACVQYFGDKALVTSGGYQRYFEENCVRYHHILDPKTGMPADTGLASVTVLAQDGTLADGLSTALFVMGMDKAVAFWRESDDFEAVFITENGEIYATDGAASLLTDCDFTVVER